MRMFFGFGVALCALPVLAVGDPPESWACDPRAFGNHDGCDCGCGAPDPDCGGGGIERCRFSYCPSTTTVLVPSSEDPTICVENECGDGWRAADEVCDDGAGDGCTEDCSAADEGYSCWGFGCHPENVCGDRFWEGDENCDDGNVVSGDGCSADCTEREIGFVCPSGEDCYPIVCGDGFVDGDEGCDDSNNASGDGCLADCSAAEDGFDCPVGPGPCSAVVCGDGVINGTEACDDSNDAGGDGCAAGCETTESGFACLEVGVACLALSPSWTCADKFYGSGDGCDCGCGDLDLDCVDGGCTLPGEFVDGCEYCYDADGETTDCPAAPTDTCSQEPAQLADGGTAEEACGCTHNNGLPLAALVGFLVLFTPQRRRSRYSALHLHRSGK